MRKTVSIALLAIVAGFAASPGCAAESDSDPAAVLEGMFRWWNGAFHQEGSFTSEAFAEHFTEDTRMFINGSLRAEGVEDLARHFQRIQAQVDHVEIVLPFEEGFSAGDKTFTSHFVRARNDGEESLERVMGWAEIRGGRLALINFLSLPIEDSAAE